MKKTLFVLLAGVVLFAGDLEIGVLKKQISKYYTYTALKYEIKKFKKLINRTLKNGRFLTVSEMMESGSTKRTLQGYKSVLNDRLLGEIEKKAQFYRLYISDKTAQRLSKLAKKSGFFTLAENLESLSFKNAKKAGEFEKGCALLGEKIAQDLNEEGLNSVSAQLKNLNNTLKNNAKRYK